MDTTTNVVNESSTKPHPVTVKVNEQPVTFQTRKATGAEIKQTAIAQGVAIQPDFNLYRKTGGNLKRIDDSETVELHDGEEFRAVTPQEPS